jgi:CheY-like chemotaxis protein
MKNHPHLVLLVEDNSDHAELIRRAMADSEPPCRIRHLAGGQAAVDYLFRTGEYADAEKSPRPRLILLDLRLPGIDGMEVLGRLKHDDGLRSIPVVILSTSKAPQDIAEACRGHANAYVVKPMGFKELRETLHDIGRFWLGRNACAETES